MIRAAEFILGKQLTIAQGSYSNYSASAGTHSGGGAVDIWEHSDAVVKALRTVGFAAWERTPAQGFSYHTHGVALDDPALSDSARSQTVAYRNGRNGLANNGADDGPNVPIRNFEEYIKMARYPNASWRPLGTQTQPRLTKRNKIILHTMVGSLSGTDSYFRQGGYTGTESHFGVGGNGSVYQWQDTDYRADANLEGNDDCISIETADRGDPFPDWNTSGDNVPPWTDRQIEANAQLIAWLCNLYDIPCRLISNTYDSTKGIGYHRQGVDPYRTHGEEYSESYGKVCPGNKRVAQIPRVIARANEILNGEEDMPSVEEFAEAVWDRVNKDGHTMGTVMQKLERNTEPERVGEAVWDRVNVDGHTMGTVAKWTGDDAQEGKALLVALKPLVEAAATGDSLTLNHDQVVAIAQATAEALGDGIAQAVADKIYQRMEA